MNALPYFALLPSTPEAPTEICLSLHYDRPANAAALAPVIRVHLAAAVAGWKLDEFNGEAPSVAERRALYKASQPPAGFLSLYCQASAPPLSSHTEIVQLILSSADPYATAWPQAATWLAENLGAWLRPNQAGLLGYTLVYRANAGTEPAEASPEVLAAVRSINGSVTQAIPPQVLVEQPHADQGWLLLLKYPQAQARGLIYLALGTGHQPDELARTAYFGQQAALPAQDIFVHKALHQSFLVSVDYDTYDIQFLKPFEDTVADLLRTVDNPQQKTRQLNDLAQQLANLTHTHWDLSRFEHSLKQQLNGIKRLFANAEMPVIARRHLATVESHWQEAHALVAQHQLVLENARIAIALVEAQENKYATTLQQHFNQLVAIGGLLVAIYSAVDVSLVQAAIKSVLPSYWLYLIRLGTAGMLTALLVAMYGVIKHFIKKKRAKQASQSQLSGLAE